MSFHISYEYRIMIIIMIVSFINPFTSSALNLALPDIGRMYSASESQLSWIIETFLMTSTICIMPLGALADRIGKRRVFRMGTIIFMASSYAVCSISSITGLFILRIIQGIGSASIFATSLAIVSLTFPAQKRGKAMGLTLAAVYSGLSLGPFIGGTLNYYFGWKSIFYFIAFFGTAALLLTQAWMKELPISSHHPSFDGTGAVLYAVSLAIIMFSLSELLSLSYAPYLLPGGILLFIIFLLRERHQPMPIIPIHLFTQYRAFSCSTLAAMLNYGATFAITFLLSFYLQRILGFTSRDAGMILLLQPVLMAVFSPFTGTLSDHISGGWLASGGMACIAVGLAILSLCIPHSTLAIILLCLVLIGIGFSLFTAPNNTIIMNAVPKEYYGMASSIVGTVRLIGQVLSTAIVTLILSQTTNSTLLLPHIQFAFIIFTILCLIGIVPSLIRNKK